MPSRIQRRQSNADEIAQSASVSPSTHIELQSITKRYGDQSAVRDLSLSIQRGELFCLLGPSGCGKTTTLSMIAGFIHPNSGEILFDDQPMVGVPVQKRNIGMVFQNYALFPHMSTYDNIAFGLRRRRIATAEERTRVADILRLVHLEGTEERLPRELSGGQQQRVALARALVFRPTVLLLDEPLSNLDAKLREEMRIELRKIHEEANITTIFVTHDQEEALSMADRVAVMKEGALQQVSSPTEIYQHPVNAFVAKFIGQSNLLSGRMTVDQHSGLVLKTSVGDLRVENHGSAPMQEFATLLIRPESLRIDLESAPGDQISLSGRIRSTMFLGSVQRVEVSVGDETFICTMNPDKGSHSFGVGDTVKVSWDPTEAVLLKQGS